VSGSGGDGNWLVKAIVVGVIGVAGTVLAAVLLEGIQGGDDPGPVVTGTTPSGATTIPVLDKQSSFTQVGARPLSLAAGSRKIWVADPTRTEAWWLDATDAPKTHLEQLPDVRHGLDDPIRPVGVAAADGAAWFVDESHDLLWRIDEATTTADPPVRVGNRPGGVAVEGGVVWVLSRAPGEVQRVDANSRSLQGQPIALPLGIPRAIAAHKGVAWVTGTAANRRGAVWKLSGDTEPEQTTGVGRAPVVAVAATDNAVWIADLNGNVSKIDPDANVVGATVRLAGRPCGIAVDKDAVWVTDSDGDQVWRLDPENALPMGNPIRVEAHPCAVTLDAGTGWIANQGDNSISRVTP